MVLLGPVAVHPTHQGEGIAALLIWRCLEVAAKGIALVPGGGVSAGSRGGCAAGPRQFAREFVAHDLSSPRTNRKGYGHER